MQPRINMAPVAMTKKARKAQCVDENPGWVYDSKADSCRPPKRGGKKVAGVPSAPVVPEGVSAGEWNGQVAGDFRKEIRGVRATGQNRKDLQRQAKCTSKGNDFMWNPDGGKVRKDGTKGGRCVKRVNYLGGVGKRVSPSQFQRAKSAGIAGRNVGDLAPAVRGYSRNKNLHNLKAGKAWGAQEIVGQDGKVYVSEAYKGKSGKVQWRWVVKNKAGRGAAKDVKVRQTGNGRLNAYGVFMKTQRARIVDKSLPVPEQGKQLGAAWRALSNEEKGKYKAEAERLNHGRQFKRRKVNRRRTTSDAAPKRSASKGRARKTV